MSFTFDHCIACPLLLAIVLCILYFWPLYCVSFTFDHCIVCPLLLAIVLRVFYFWPLYCVSFTFGHCIVCPLLLAIVLCVLYFWSLYCVSFTFDHCIVCPLLLAIVLCVLWFTTSAITPHWNLQYFLCFVYQDWDFSTFPSIIYFMFHQFVSFIEITVFALFPATIFYLCISLQELLHVQYFPFVSVPQKMLI